MKYWSEKAVKEKQKPKHFGITVDPAFFCLHYLVRSFTKSLQKTFTKFCFFVNRKILPCSGNYVCGSGIGKQS